VLVLQQGSWNLGFFLLKYFPLVLGFVLEKSSCGASVSDASVSDALNQNIQRAQKAVLSSAATFLAFMWEER
jgi:hypothetical protein